MLTNENTVFVEQMVRRNIRGGRALARILTYAIGALVCGGLLFLSFSGLLIQLAGPLGAFLMMFCIMGAAGALWLTYRLGASFYKEYEYIFTNGILDVDCITAKRKRKRLCSIAVKDAEKGGRYHEKALAREQFAQEYLACADPDDPENRFIVFTAQKKGRCLLVFTPDERTRQHMKPYLPRFFPAEFLM